jgi:hypothetical protein
MVSARLQSFAGAHASLGFASLRGRSAALRASRNLPAIIVEIAKTATFAVARAKGSPVRTATLLSGIELERDDGSRAALGSTWRDRPVVLVFIRHFG